MQRGTIADHFRGLFSIPDAARLGGIVSAIVVHMGLGAAGIAKSVPAPLVVDLAFATFFGLVIWLAWLG